jgi:hypothetical protein
MATLASNVLTMADWAKRLDPDGKTAFIVEQLNQVNAALDDMMFKEGNLPTGEQTTIRTGLPTSYYRQINAGVPKSKSTTAQVTEHAAILEARSEVDVDEAMLNGNTSEYRLSESIAFMQSMSQKQATTLFYGSAANPEEYVGFANRYNLLSAPNGQNILDAGGTGSDNASAWLTGWGERTVFGVFPKGSKAGLEHRDLGEIDAFDANNDRFRAYADQYKWKNGLVVKNWEYVVRIANVDISDLIAATGTQAPTASTAIIKMMARAIDRLPTTEGVKTAFYVNRTVASHLRIAALDKSSSAVTIEPSINQFGDTIHTMRFLGIPVRIVDALINTEARVA